MVLAVRARLVRPSRATHLHHMGRLSASRNVPVASRLTVRARLPPRVARQGAGEMLLGSPGRRGRDPKLLLGAAWVLLALVARLCFGYVPPLVR